MQFLTPTAHRHFECTGSTNTDLIHAITDGTHPHDLPHLYTADHQTAGRGQHGRSWVSGAGNVLLSLYVPMGQDNFNLSQLSGLLSLVVGYQIAQLDIIQNINKTHTQHTLPLIGVKWANDVGFYDDELNCFKKLAGILIEPVFKKFNDKNTLVGVVIGVGLNVDHSPKIKDGLYQATCLQELLVNNKKGFSVRPELVEGLKENPYGSTGSPRTVFFELSAKELYIPMANAIFKAIESCNQCQDKNALGNFINEFNQVHILQGKWVQIFIQNNMTDIHAQGNCIGIGNNGELLLENNHQITPIYAGMAKIQGNF